ncbi:MULTISPECIES: NAD(P)/FAD-dependent oxidoreductase [Nocardiopsis]|uniref:Thioredoxin reductase n=1 Tax=Nocardiopsis sinuspersici TaxID=501010 RepID=A0A1V3BZW7_9ACTN|nr:MULTISPECIES: NAD(P)/FAD-dependent oxidoreductase [Nocardiopsis]OOC54005.1 thioredoxin reductase [Nocardiopsis sinuspersici]
MDTTAPHNAIADHYEVVVIGGGAAGLSGALALSRARRSVLVVDEGRPRNAPAAGVHTFLTREGTPPAQLLEIGRAEITGYGAQVRTGRVVHARARDEGGFDVHLEDGAALTADRLLVATGLVDELPPIPGLAERWGRDVLHCPYCHGWEVRDEAIGVVATNAMAVHQALLWRQWSSRVTLLQHGGADLDRGERDRLRARGVGVVAGPVSRVLTEDDRLVGVETADGATVELRALVVATYLRARVRGLEGLGLKVAQAQAMGQVVGTQVETDAMGATNVPGVWAAGNAATPFDQVVGGAAAGLRAGAAINADLVAEQARRAVEALPAA